MPGLRTDSVASCLATSIEMQAEVRGIALTRLEVLGRSESDSRGMLGNIDVVAGPQRFWLDVKIEGNAADEALRELVAASNAVSPMPNGLRRELQNVVQGHVAASQPE